MITVAAALASGIGASSKCKMGLPIIIKHSQAKACGYRRTREHRLEAGATGDMVDFDSHQEFPSQSLIIGREESLRGGRGSAGGDAWATAPPALPSENLILIGTVHGDPRGYERVTRLLEWLRPEVVTVEISRFSVRYRRAWEDRWRRQLQEALAELPPGAAGHPAMQKVAAQIALPFEYRAARDYSRENGVRCLPLDLGGLSRRHLPRYGRELLSPGQFAGSVCRASGFFR